MTNDRGSIMDRVDLKTAFVQHGEGAMELASRVGPRHKPVVVSIERDTLLTGAILARELGAPLEMYRGLPTAISLSGRTVVVCDDRVHTGDALRSALDQLRKQRPLELVVAVISAPETALRS